VAVYIQITNPGKLIDDQVGISGVGALAGLLTDTQGLVDNAAADKIRTELASQGVEATVTVVADSPLQAVKAGILPFVLGALAGAGLTIVLSPTKKEK